VVIVVTESNACRKADAFLSIQQAMRMPTPITPLSECKRLI
jgi:hypothetical protein